jgi:hypothetical protein
MQAHARCVFVTLFLKCKESGTKRHAPAYYVYLVFCRILTAWGFNSMERRQKAVEWKITSRKQQMVKWSTMKNYTIT